MRSLLPKGNKSSGDSDGFSSTFKSTLTALFLVASLTMFGVMDAFVDFMMDVAVSPLGIDLLWASVISLGVLAIGLGNSARKDGGYGLMAIVLTILVLTFALVPEAVETVAESTGLGVITAFVITALYALEIEGENIFEGVRNYAK